MSAEPDEKPKLNLTLTHEGTSIQVKVKATMTFKKIFDAAEKKFGKDPGTLRFTYDGERVHEYETPAQREMEDGDEIQAFLWQEGGGAF
ncbi:ubiquitin-like protein [Moniliophthora roreri MCA 2997]|uniref:Ubiquitin-like protein n=1 Tax=Moniliophthora roreri (strain MCA 2997) TaxID=1381753 RepID=V2WT38_MONRO|nr:ubiquitin-like protein [Moniliophthora roreri MCA 2997]